jgi:phage shock protein A
MFNEIRHVFKRSIEAFRQELSTREPEDQVAELLSAMRRELVATRAHIPELEQELQRARQDLDRERESLAQCERRGTLAARIHDMETVRVAEEFAERHRERIVVLEQKVVAAEGELGLKRREAEEMKVRYQEADTNRFTLLAQIRRSAAAESMRAAHSRESGAFADFERMEDRMERDATIVDARMELDDPPPPPRDRRAEAEAVEARLQELKRRMGRGE